MLRCPPHSLTDLGNAERGPMRYALLEARPETPSFSEGSRRSGRGFLLTNPELQGVFGGLVASHGLCGP